MDKVRGLQASGLVEMASYNVADVSRHKCDLHRSKGPYAVLLRARILSV